MHRRALQVPPRAGSAATSARVLGGNLQGSLRSMRFELAAACCLSLLVFGVTGCDYGDHPQAKTGSAGSACPDDGSGYDASAQALECRVLELVNQVRASGTTCSGAAAAPVPALAMNSALRSSARAHAIDMATNNYFDHNSLDGTTFFDRITAAGYTFSAAGENLAAGSPTAEDAMQQWLKSTAGHCENIMSPVFVDIGVGYARNPASQFEHYWVQNFGAP